MKAKRFSPVLALSIVALFSSLFFAPSAEADWRKEVKAIIAGEPVEAPPLTDEEEYTDWVLVNLPEEAYSPYTPDIFQWLEANKNQPLPVEVAQDENKIFVDVDSVIAVTDEIEAENESLVARTFGSNIYAEIDATPDDILRAWKFKYGLPPQQKERGVTFPADGVFVKQRREEFFPLPRFGAGTFLNVMHREGVGKVQALRNANLIFQRGSAEEGYKVFFQHLQPIGETATGSILSVLLIEPLANGKTAYKLATRMIGQSYWFEALGGGSSVNWWVMKSTLRASFGFNIKKNYNITKEFLNLIKELQETGDIKGTQPHGVSSF